jgi:hypothetical protein
MATPTIYFQPCLYLNPCRPFVDVNIIKRKDDDQSEQPWIAKKEKNQASYVCQNQQHSARIP